MYMGIYISALSVNYSFITKGSYLIFHYIIQSESFFLLRRTKELSCPSQPITNRTMQ